MELTRADALEMAEELGIEHHKTAKTDYVVKLINELTDGDHTVADPKSPKIEEGEDKPETKPENEDTVFCMIHSNDRDNEEVEVVGSVNGETYQAQIGEETNFPKKFLPSIECAVMEVKVAILDDAGQPTGKYKERKVKRYVIERL